MTACQTRFALSGPSGLQGSWPVSRSRSKPSSSSTGIPRSAALESLAPPGSDPTTTAVVFWDTLPGALPPRDLIAASASSL